jgi:hypothetical protein
MVVLYAGANENPAKIEVLRPAGFGVVSKFPAGPHFAGHLGVQPERTLREGITTVKKN